MALYSRRKSKHSGLSDETKEGILAVFLLAVALLLLLSLFDAAGAWGVQIRHGLDFLLGSLQLLAPVIFLSAGYFVAVGSFPDLAARKRIGLFGTLIGLFGLASLCARQWPESISGGVIGDAIASVPVKQFGTPASVVVFSAVLFISIFLWEAQSYRIAKNIVWYVLEISFRSMRWLTEWLSSPKSTSVETSVQPVSGEVGQGSGFRRAQLKGATTQPEGAQTVSSPDLLSASHPTSVVRKKAVPHQPSFPLSMLDHQTSQPESGNIEVVRTTIQKTFLNFGISVEMADVHVGPTVTQYTLKPAEGIKLSAITALHNDLALQLAAHPIRIEAPIPGKSLVGIEVPNKRIAVVSLRSIIESPEYQAAANSPTASQLLMAIGRDVAGEPWIADLAKMPHMLLAGATGSGKTVAINAIIISLLYRNSPEEMRMLLIDPKRVELTLYNDIPHLITPVVTDVRKTINALRWVIGEMDRRFDELSKSGYRDINSYNEQSGKLMPYLVVVIDELADLMMTAANEVEACIIRLAQLARAVGIHLILATQRPSVDVITGLIKANITARIAFSVASSIDSRTILDTSGAEKLLGRGDLLFVTADLSKPKRLQGAFVAERETKKVAESLRTVGTPTYADGVQDRTSTGVDASGGGWDDEDSDALLEDAKQVIIQAGKASASLLQRRLKVGYARAARILDLLEAQGVIGPGDGAKPRELLIGRGENGTIEMSESDFSTDETDQEVEDSQLE